jgi:hypothetical protein
MRLQPTRREFLQWSAAAGLAPAFALERWQDPATPAARLETLLPTEYLHRGILALSRAHRVHWTEAHHGAAILAGWFFCREMPLDERTIRAVRANLDAYIASKPEMFAAAVPAGAAAPADRIVEALAGHMTELRGAAHDQIFAALAVKALQAAPEMAVEPVVDGICRLLAGFVARFRPEDSDYDRRHPMQPYEGDADLIRATFAALDRPHAHLAARGVVGAIHWVTHADALVTLGECGFADVARLGYRAHQTFINHPVVEQATGAGVAAVPARQWLAAEYWESEAPRRPRAGTWLNGHTLKLPYSLFRLSKRIDGAAPRGIDRAPWLVAEFERGRA